MGQMSTDNEYLSYIPQEYLSNYIHTHIDVFSNDGRKYSGLFEGFDNQNNIYLNECMEMETCDSDNSESSNKITQLGTYLFPISEIVSIYSRDLPSPESMNKILPEGEALEIRHFCVSGYCESLVTGVSPVGGYVGPYRGVEDDDEFSFHLARYRPEEIQKLASKTKFTRKEIQLMYRGFKQECPTGMVDEDAFKHIFAQFFPQGDATNYAHYVFNTIKQKQTGKISFEDFLNILSKVSRGSVQEKMQWIFGLYDLNGDGLISKTEMLDVVSSIYEMVGRSTLPMVEDSSAKDHVEKIFHLIDTNKDGVVTIEELMQWCSRDENFLRSLDTLDTIL